MTLVETALILFAFLRRAAGGWAVGSRSRCSPPDFVGMQFTAETSRPAALLATVVWGNSASWSLGAAAVHLDGRNLFRTRLSEEMFRGFSPWLNCCPRGSCTSTSWACGVFGSSLPDRRRNTARCQIALPSSRSARLRRMLALGSLAGAGTLGILIPPSIMM